MFCSSTDFFPSLRGALTLGTGQGGLVGYSPVYVVSGDSRTLRGHQGRGYLGLVPDTCSGWLGKDAHAYQYLASAISGAAHVHVQASAACRTGRGLTQVRRDWHRHRVSPRVLSPSGDMGLCGWKFHVTARQLVSGADINQEISSWRRVFDTHAVWHFTPE